MKIISNLNQTVLCPFQIIADACLQLESSYSPVTELKTITSLLFQQVCPLDSPTDWVNLDDSVGDLTAMRAFELTNKLLSVLDTYGIQTLEFHILLGTQTLTEDNIFSLIYLSDTCLELSIDFYVESKQITQLDNAVSILKDKLKTTTTYHASNTFFSDVKNNVCLEKINSSRKAMLYEYGFTFSDDTSENPGINVSKQGAVLNYAWRCLKAGAYRLSCQVLEMALAFPLLPKNMHEEFFLQLQAIRFLSHQHHLVANETFPEKFDTIDDSRVAYLYFIKAFSATMIKNLQMAEICYKKANISTEMKMSDEDSIYKLNLYALFLVLVGDSDNAFKLEAKLLQYINTHHPKAVAVNHVIRMNIARLYKKSKQFDKSEIAYYQAYEQLSGCGFTLFDSMNYEMDKAILSEARGKTKKALFSWLKVTLYWFSCPNPYSLAIRPRLTLAQEKVVDTMKPLSLEKVHQFLLNKLTILFELLSDENDENQPSASNEMYDFISDACHIKAHKTCHVVDNIVIYSYDKKNDDRSKLFTPTEKKLRCFVTKLIKKWFLVRDNIEAVSIETLYDLPIPNSQETAIAQALLADCNDCYFHDSYITLSEQNLAESQNKISVKLPDMLNSIEQSSQGLDLIYRRSFLNQTVSDPEAIKLIERLQIGEHISVNELKQTSPGLFRQMIRHKIITVTINANTTVDQATESVEKAEKLWHSSKNEVDMMGTNA